MSLLRTIRVFIILAWTLWFGSQWMSAQVNDSTGKWSEVGALVALSSVGLEPQPPTKSPGEMYAFVAGMEYRYMLMGHVQVGLSTSYAVYGYPNYLQGGTRPAQNNHATTIAARLTARSSSIRTNSAWFLYAGYGIAHVRQYAADLKENDADSTVYAMPDVARWDHGFDLGLGFETGTFANDMLRMRFTIDYFLSPTSDGIQILNVIPSVAISASF